MSKKILGCLGLFLVGLFGVFLLFVSLDTTVEFEINVEGADNSEYGYMYDIGEISLVKGSFDKSLEYTGMIIVSGDLDLWGGKASEDLARIRILSSSKTEEEVDKFEDGSGAPIMHHFMVMDDDGEMYFYEIIDAEWLD